MLSRIRYSIVISAAAEMRAGNLDTLDFTIKNSSGLQGAIVLHVHLIFDGESGSHDQTIVSTVDKGVRRFGACLNNFLMVSNRFISNQAVSARPTQSGELINALCANAFLSNLCICAIFFSAR